MCASRHAEARCRSPCMVTMHVLHHASCSTCSMHRCIVRAVHGCPDLLLLQLLSSPELRDLWVGLVFDPTLGEDRGEFTWMEQVRHAPHSSMRDA